MPLPPALQRLRLPVIAAPLPDAAPEHVIACCRSGLLGSFPACNAGGLEPWLARITATLAADDAPFAVAHAVHRGNARLEHDLEMCVTYRAPVILTSMDSRPAVTRAIHAYGGLVLHGVTDGETARAAIAAGADGLVLHPGARDAFPLIRELRAWFAGPLAVAGIQPHGAAILAAQAMGADLAQAGLDPADTPRLAQEYQAARTTIAPPA